MKLINLEKSDVSILGVILAGGQARRMGGIDKGRLKIGDASILEITTKTLSFQLDKIILNANGDQGRFSDLEIQVIPDTIKGYVGPLAGILSGMRFAEKNGFTSPIPPLTNSFFNPLRTGHFLAGYIRCVESHGYSMQSIVIIRQFFQIRCQISMV